MILPEAFIQRMKEQLAEEADAFFESLTTTPPTSIRLHHLKGKTSFNALEQVPWCQNGFYLRNRPSFHLDPHWHGGAYYVQEASSMILDNVLSQLVLDHSSKIFLDMCAAPGGKTGILAKHMRTQDVLVANEVIPARRAVLRENMYKGGYLNTFITGANAETFQTPFADIILVDAPCAGEGMMRKEPEAIHQWSTLLVRECSMMQQRIVTNVARALLPGGYMIYCTCSYSPSENMLNVAEFVKSFPLSSVQLNFPDNWNITKLENNDLTGYQMFPHKVKGEGLFFAVLQNNEPQYQTHKRHKKYNEFIPVPEWLKRHLHQPDQLMIRKESQHQSFIHSDAVEKANEVLSYLPKAEITAEGGQLKGKDFIPSHFLAMSRLFETNQMMIDLEKEKALDYLERNTQTLPHKELNGWYLVSFEETVLGWVKQTSQGMKNHYPLQWRLRSRKGKDAARDE